MSQPWFPSHRCFGGRARTARLAVPAVCVLWCALVLHAQDPQPNRYRDFVNVSRVLVDARVVDEAGSPIAGLGAEAFKVKIDGKPARVESALWVGGNSADPDTKLVEPSSGNDAEDALPPMGRLIVLLFQKDLEPSRIIGLMRMLIHTSGFLDTLSPADRVAILSFDSHLKVWLDFTNDREVLRYVLTHGILFERPGPIQESEGLSLVKGLDPALGRRTYSIEKALGEIGRALEPLPGAKSVVLIGYGFGRYSHGWISMENEYEPARNALLAARASVFSLDVTDADYHALEAGLELVSEETGGFFVRTHVFPSQAMRRLAGALAGYYVLFVEKPELHPGMHSIDVQLKGRHGTVLARSGYIG